MPPPSTTPSERVLIVSASVGAGHDGAARELSCRLEARGVAVETRDFIDALPRWVGVTVREGYTRTVTHTPWFYDWLYRAMERRGPVRRVGLTVCRLGARRVLRWCDDTGADAVVSTYPLASQTLGQLVARGRLDLPTATFLTDPSVHALWVNPHIRRHLTTLPATAEIGRRDYGIDMTVVGPLVPSHFAAPLPAERRSALVRELALDEGRPVALVVTGSLGLGDVRRTVDAILATGAATPLVLCGRNHGLLEELGNRQGVLALGWRGDMPDLMQVADVLVHNAGGLSFSESLVSGLPAVTYACIPGHGRANGDVLAAAGLAPLAGTVDELRTALRDRIRPGARTVIRSVLATVEHDAGRTVIAELRDGAAPARTDALRARRRRRTTVRRRMSAVAASAVIALTSLGMTEGVSAATSRGYGVATMPAGSVAVVVRPTTLAHVDRFAPQLRRLSAAVLVPDSTGSGDLQAARALSARGVTLLTAGCPTSSLLHHSRRQRCGAAETLRRAGIPVAPTVVRTGDLEGLDLVVAERDDARLVPTRSIGSAGRVWVVDLPRKGHGGSLPGPALADLRREADHLHLRMLPVTDARARA